MTERYPVETLDPGEDDGTMVRNVEDLAKEVIGHRIVEAEKLPYGGFQIQLDNGKLVQLHDGGDCCAFTQLESFLIAVDRVEHVITGVGTTDEYQTWHIYAAVGDVLEMKVGWSCGNPFYYGYGFTIDVVDAPRQKAVTS